MTRIRDEGEDTPLGRLWSFLDDQASAGGLQLSAEFACVAAADRLGMSGACLVVADVSGAGVPRYASGELGTRLMQLGVTVGDGPVAEVLDTGIPVFAADLGSAASRRRWPLFAPLVVDEGVQACFALPLVLGAIRVGVLTLYATGVRAAGSELLGEAILYAELVLYLLIAEQEGRDLARPDNGFPLAAPEVHQATGMVAAQLDVGIDDAFARLRAKAFADGRGLTDVAADVVARRLRFDRDPDRR